METFPYITIVIPAYNEEKYISQKLENTLLLDYPANKLQILVAADGSSDDTLRIVESYSVKGVEVSYIPERNGKMAAIIRAMKLSRGEVIVFSDANNMYEKQAIRELVLPFSNPKVGATTGAKLIVEDGRELSSAEGFYWRYESAIKQNESKVDSCVSSVGEILAIRKEFFSPPKEKIINDDHYIILDILRRGYRVIYTPHARSFEYVSMTAQDEVERRARMNAGLFQTIFMSGKLLPFNRPLLVWQVVSHKYFRAFLPFAFLLLFFSNLAAAAFSGDNISSAFTAYSPIILLFFYSQISFYLFALVGNFFEFKGLIGKLLYLPVFLVNSNLATFMGFYAFVINKQSHIWKRVRR
ncbi:MAG: glycosyltransferase family 2 protein [bacterium]|nr:glycosyltransferase family 2 protein [bacterium]